jgi:preprotein translocase subunit YajC
MLQDAAAPNSAAMNIGLMVLIIVIFYFFMIRPQMKRQKELKKFRDELKRGDKVVTTGGLYGKIVEIQETTITLEVADKVQLKVDKFAVLKDTSDLANQK